MSRLQVEGWLMGRPLRVLMIEDNEDDALLLVRELQRGGYEVEFERVETAEAMQSALTQKTWDLILSDYTMPRFNAPKALEVLKASGLDLPFIISSGTIGEETAVTALKAGAHDFFVKGKFARLGPAIERELREAETRRQRKRAEEALREKERLLFEAQRIGHIGSWSYEIVTDNLMYSDEMYRLLDISPQEFQHNEEGFLSLIYSADRASVSNWMENIKAGKQVRELDSRVFHRNSELRYIRCSGAVEFDSQGKPAHFIGTAQDVTERKLAEIQIRQQIERLNALRKIDQAIISSFDLRSTMHTVLSQVISQLQVDAADILLLDPEGNMLVYAAGQGFRSTSVETTQLHVGDGHAGRAAQERRLIKIENLKNQPEDPHRTKLLAEEDFVSYIGVPLIVKGKEKGVLEVFHRAPLYPYPEWLDFLNTLAGQAAIAVEDAQLFENLERSNRELSQAYDATIEGWSRALDLRDRETEGHTQRVTEMTLKLARAFGLAEEQLLHIRWGALLHDIGKMGVPDHILLKPGELTAEEWVRMKSHPQYAYDLLKPIAFLAPTLDIPYSHHEKWDGRGYPRGLKGEEIPLVARLFAVVDVWDALRSDRPYRKAWTRDKTLEHIKSLSGTHFDPKAVEYFLELIKE
jgi:putative nucleotidyltransferase with HDIG domain